MIPTGKNEEDTASFILPPLFVANLRERFPGVFLTPKYGRSRAEAQTRSQITQPFEVIRTGFATNIGWLFPTDLISEPGILLFV